MNTESKYISDDNVIKVLVVDDSAFMRKSITLMLESDPEIRVVATARDGQEGIELIGKLNPDLVTLDIQMPRMDGLEALKIIMAKMPLPVLMVSSLTTESAQATIQALDLGAVDFISKDLDKVSTNIKNIKDELIDKIKQIARSRLIQTQFRMKRFVQSSHDKKIHIKPKFDTVTFSSVIMNLNAVVVGISTGGPQALLKIIPKIPEMFPIGIAIVQHMPANFTRTLSERLNSISKVLVKEAEQGEIMEPGKVLIAPGAKHMTLNNTGSRIMVEISEEPANSLYKPSADIMMTSAASAFKGPLLGIIMTGMGKDGVEGLKSIKAKGGYVIAQNEESCIIYGMPRAALEEGIVDSVQSIENIVSSLVQISNARV